ncbi:hypothetical protein CYLTODRAFT_361895 [Cylindrobasidium torrendii FP15055 ss-10]|uniref:Uncharacterized protein n=1 Tax=Cylindrobasidium torrendii FP15055 ss-10 TaxID=1314674 RepID=A0A0D7AY17_9AGAR|nr:hypothetical protein CYLTODRAFT_361895 [Cylindrobasidium torrendii FP15055 ss-10]
MPIRENPPWPAQTPAPNVDLNHDSLSSSQASSSTPSNKRRSLKRRRTGAGVSLEHWGRQVVDQAAVEEAEYNCRVFSDNTVVTCFPTSDSTFPQHQYATVVWNSGLPEFTQTNKVNLYLFRGDSREPVLSLYNQTNPSGISGSTTALVDDTWFGSQGANWDGSDLNYTFYWVVTRNDTELTGSEATQAHFTAVQTTYADSVVSSMASASSASAASMSSLSASLTMSGQGASSTGPGGSGDGDGNGNGSGGDGNVQSGGNDGGFPHWAIAVIVVLGFLAIVTSCILAFFIMRRIRRRNAEYDSNRNSMGSSSPMMAHIGNTPGSPILATTPTAAAQEQQSSVGHGQRPPSIVSPDGASTVSRTGSAGDAGPFSGADAAIMADAFRKALRKPDFAGATVEEGESPDSNTRGELINRELADEGRDIRSVASSKGVRVETMSESGDTVHDSDYHR